MMWLTMFHLRFFRLRIIVPLALVMILAASAYALAAANTVAVSDAGDGAAAVKPYTVSGIKYTLDAAVPTQIRSVTFAVSPTGGALAPATVRARINSGSWIACSGGPVNWSCSFSPPYPTVTASPPPTLYVIAAQ